MTADITDDDMVRAIELLMIEKKKEVSKLAFNNEKMEELRRVYEDLDIPKHEAIRIVTFQPAYTIIHQTNMDMVYDKGFAGSIDEESHYRLDGSRGYTRLEDSQDSHSGRSYNPPEEVVRLYGESHKTNTFYLNTVHVCPFCSKSSVHDHLLDNEDFFNNWRFGEKNKTPSNMATYPAKYKRCYSCDTITRKEYLKNKSEEVDHWGNREHKSLYESIYPKPIKFTKKYYAEKRVKKLLKVRPLSSSESTFFNMLLGSSKIAGLANIRVS